MKNSQIGLRSLEVKNGKGIYRRRKDKNQRKYYGNTYYSFNELKYTIEKYIVYYNEKRIKEKLGWMSPVEYRLSALAA